MIVLSRFPRVLARERRANRWIDSVLVWLAFLAGIPVYGQLPATRLHRVFPPGGQIGASVDVTVNGVDLDEMDRLVFSHPKITAIPKMAPPQPFDKQPRPLPGQFTVTISPDVPSGIYEVRGCGLYGTSTACSFAVSHLPQRVEQGSNHSLASAMPLELNSTVSGHTAADTYDVFQFSATRGTRILIHCETLRLDSRLDAVLEVFDASGRQLARSRDLRRNEPLLDFEAPADGTYRVRVHDSTYRGGATFFYRLSLSTQPHIDFVLPAVGVPGTTETFTLLGRNLPGSTPSQAVAFGGASLQQLSAEITLPEDATDFKSPLPNAFLTPADLGRTGFQYHLKTPAGSSNAAFIARAEAPVVPELEPNDSRDQPQRIASLPCEVVGQFDGRDDADWFAFEAKPGSPLALEIFSQRRGLLTDPFLLLQHVVTDAEGNDVVTDVVEVDDIDTKLNNPPFDGPQRDAGCVFTPQVAGTYRVMVRDLYAGAVPDPQQVYALSIGPPKHDFQLLATFKMLADPDPNKAFMAAPILRPGGALLTMVQAYRRAGFDDEIAISVDGLPAGVTCLPAVIASGQNQTILALVADETVAPTSMPLKIIGQTVAGDRTIRREAFFGSVVWDKHNAKETTHARIRSDARLSVIEDTQPFSISLPGDASRTISLGSKLSVPVQVTRREGVKGVLTMKAHGLPEGITAAALSLDEKTNETTLEITLEASAPLGAHTFYLSGQSKVAYRRNPRAAAAAEAEKARIEQVIVRLTEEKQAAIAAQVEAETKLADLAQGSDAEERTEATAAAKSATAAATAAVTRAAENLAAAQAQLKIVNQRAIDLAAAAKPRDIDVVVQSPPVTLLVVPAKSSSAKTNSAAP